MPQKRATHCVNIFLQMVQAHRKGVDMVPRSANDKEYFAQDWFAARLAEAGLAYQQQGRNSYPDFWVGDIGLIEGCEIKALRFSQGRPARKGIDFNSTIPSGLKDNRPIFLVFFLYTGSGANRRPVHTISIAHADLINADHTVADEHINVAIHYFGSYADGFIRNRKMYVFPHPITIDPGGLGRQRLIVPSSWRINHPRLDRVKTIKRTLADHTIDSYTIRLLGRGKADVKKRKFSDGGKIQRFDVFEMSPSSDP